MDELIKKTRRFWPLVIIKSEFSCWPWVGAKNKTGYGLFHLGNGTKKLILAHRFSWQLHRGNISKGLVLCHKCDNPSCVNPDHLFLGTHKDNTQDAIKKGRKINVNGRFIKTIF